MGHGKYMYVLWSVECYALATGGALCLNVCTVQHVVSAVGSGVCYVGCGGVVCVVWAEGGGVYCVYCGGWCVLWAAVGVCCGR